MSKVSTVDDSMRKIKKLAHSLQDIAMKSLLSKLLFIKHGTKVVNIHVE